MSCEESPLGIFIYWFTQACDASFYSDLDYVRPIPLAEYLFLFGSTLALEAPFYFVFLRKRLSWLKLLFAILVLNLATHPIVCYVMPSLSEALHFTYGGYVFLAESFAPVMETLILWRGFRIDFKIAALAAFSANLFSWLFGSWIAYY